MHSSGNIYQKKDSPQKFNANATPPLSRLHYDFQAFSVAICIPKKKKKNLLLPLNDLLLLVANQPV